MKFIESLLRIAGATFALAFFLALVVMRIQNIVDTQVVTTLEAVPPQPVAIAAADGPSWFQGAKPFCNAVEVEQHVEHNPAPDNFEGTAHEAACWALAGDVFKARDLIRTLDRDERWQAANVVFNIAHPIADAGNEVAAGPVMEMVVEFWPNNYMALYHAGAARYELLRNADDAEAAAHYLERFLEHYSANDGWTRSAEGMLAELNSR